MTQSEIYDRILMDIMADDYISFKQSVKKIRDVSRAYWDAEAMYLERGVQNALAPYLQEHYPQYYKELTNE